MRLKLRVFITMATALCMPLIAKGAFTSFPFSDFFESGSIDNAVWVASGPGNAVPTSDQNQKVTGNFGMSVDSTVLTLTGPSAPNAKTNVWTVMHVKPVFVDDTETEPIVTDADAISFYFRKTGPTTGTMKVYDDAAWVEVTGTTFTLGAFYRLAIQANFYDGTWQVFSGASGATTLNALSGPLDMNADFIDDNPVQENRKFTSFVIEAGEHAYFDNIGLSAPGAEAVGNGFVSVLKTVAGQTTLQVPGHDYGAAVNQMDQRVGEDLRAGLVSGDKVWVPSISGGGFMDFTAKDFTAVEPFLEGAGTFADCPVNRTTQIIVKRGELGSDYFAFFPYTTLSTIQDTPSDDGGNPTVWGPNKPNGGFNPYVWPHSTTKTVGPAIGFDSAASGDRIITLNPSKTCFFDGAKWREGRNEASATLSPGQAFWYYRAATVPDGVPWRVATVGP